MIYHIDDNQKIKLENNTAVVINNNSKVYIDESNSFDGVFNNSTITINKGNSVSYLSGDLSSVTYGKSQTFSKEFNSDSQHEFFNDYNFPNAKYYLNGYKTNFAVLLNNGISAFWTTSDRGLLIGDIEVDNVKYLPTRLNGYNAVYNISPSLGALTLDKKYNGTIQLNLSNRNLTLSAFDVSNLYITNGTLVGKLQFKNIDNVTIDNLNSQTITIENVKNIQIYKGILQDSSIIIKNSSISIPDLIMINRVKSYNTFGSISIDNRYDQYILSGDATVLTVNTNHNNVFLSQNKYEIFTKHYYDNNYYESNLPVGSVIWYPQAWSAFYPQHDKNHTVDDGYKGTINIYAYGDPMSKNWALCDGSSTKQSLYEEIYGKTNAPNYVVDETGYTNIPDCSGLHYLTEPSIVMFPPNLIEVTPTSVRTATLDEQLGDNKHKTSHTFLLQTKVDLKGRIYGNWRNQQFIDVNFKMNIGKLPEYYKKPQILSGLKIRFSTYACSGDAWWYCWNGGTLSSLTEAGCLPSTTFNGKTYIGGYEMNSVVKKGIWYDTRNIPKLALQLSKSSNAFTLSCVTKDENGVLDVLASQKLMKNASKNLRIQPGYNIEWRAVGGKGSDNTRQIDNNISVNYLNDNYLLKTYELSLNMSNFKDLTKLPSSVSATITFQLSLPSIEGWNHTRHGNYWSRWINKRNRDDGDSSRLYNDYWNTNYISFLKNIKFAYHELEISSYAIELTDPILTQIGTTYYGSGYHVKLTQKAIYRSAGFYRRLNPWIKIDADQNDEVKKNYLPKSSIYNTDTNSIKVLKMKRVGDIFITTGNQTKYWDLYQITDNSMFRYNMISSCFVPDNYNDYLNSYQERYIIQSFAEDIDMDSIVPGSMQVLGDKVIKFDSTYDGYFKDTTLTTTCNIIACQIRPISGVELDSKGLPKNVYDDKHVYNAILMSGNIPDNFVSQQEYSFKVPSFPNKARGVQDSDIETMEKETYTVYTFDRNTGTFYAEPSFLKMAINHQKLDNIGQIIETKFNSLGYINTNYNLPIFHLIEKDSDNVQVVQNYFQNSNWQPGPYFLCTTNRLTYPRSQIQKYYFTKYYDETTSGGKIMYPNTVSTIVEYYWNPNIIDISGDITFTDVNGRVWNGTFNPNRYLSLEILQMKGYCKVYKDYVLTNRNYLSSQVDGGIRAQRWTPETVVIPPQTSTSFNGVVKSSWDETVMVSSITSGFCDSYIIDTNMSLTATLEDGTQEVYNWNPEEPLLDNTSATINSAVVKLNAASITNINTIGKCQMFDKVYLQDIPLESAWYKKVGFVVNTPHVFTKLTTSDSTGSYYETYEWSSDITTIPPYTSAEVWRDTYRTDGGVTVTGSEMIQNLGELTRENSIQVILQGSAKKDYWVLNHETVLKQRIKLEETYLSGNTKLIEDQEYRFSAQVSPAISVALAEHLLVGRLSGPIIYLSTQILENNISFTNFNDYETQYSNYLEWQKTKTLKSCTFYSFKDRINDWNPSNILYSLNSFSGFPMITDEVKN